MNLLAYLDSKVWAIESRAMTELRMKAAQNNLDMSKLAAEFEERKAQLAKAPLGSGMRARLKTGAIQENGVAVINISGPIFNVEGWFDELVSFYFGGTSYQALQSDLETIANDGQVKSFGVYVHSPGGDAFGMTETANKIAALSKQKSSIGYAYGMACSAAFGLISATGTVYADASAWIGSVGVVTQWADFTGFYEKLGIAYEEVTSTNAPFKRLDIRKPEHRAVLMQEIDGVENEFVRLLAKNFGISVEKVRQDFGQGAVMTAKPAKSAGMIHEIGSWANVLSELQKIARKAGETNARTSADNTGELEMGLKDDVKALAVKLGLKVADPEENGDASTEGNGNEPTAAGDETAAKLAASEARERDLQAKLNELNAKAAEEKQAALKTEAENFALAEVKAGRLFTAEKDTFVGAYLQAAADDESYPLAEGSRVDNLKALQSKRVPHGFTEESLTPGALQTVPLSDSPEAKLKAEADAQADAYVGTVGGGLKVVK